MNKALLESKLSTTILGYDIIRTTPTAAFRIKVAKALLHNVITHACTNDCVVHPNNHIAHLCQVPVTVNTTTTTQQSITITSWNCRGLSTGAPYIDHILNTGSDIVLSEHWLWPYELHKLDELNPEYHGQGRADSRLTETSDSCSRGCGGVGILWKKSFDVTPISDIQSDRICGIWKCNFTANL